MSSYIRLGRNRVSVSLILNSILFFDCSGNARLRFALEDRIARVICTGMNLLNLRVGSFCACRARNFFFAL